MASFLLLRFHPLRFHPLRFHPLRFHPLRAEEVLMRPSRIALSLCLLVVPAWLSGCTSDKAAGPGHSCSPECDQPKLPPGVPAFHIVKDDATGPSDGQDVTLRVVLKQKIKRDAIYPALGFLYRYAMTRDTFQPRNFSGEFYLSDSDATAGTAPVAKIYKAQSDKGPKCDNSIKMELPEQVERAFAHSMNRGEVEDLEDTCHLNEKKKIARVDDNFKHKPTFKVDESVKGVEVTYPYLESGKDEYVASLTFNEAMTFWAEFMNTMFQKAQDLQQITYIGLLNDEPVMKITVTRQEYESKLSTVQETIASYAAIIFAKLGMHKIDDKGAKAEQESHNAEMYKNALGFLPKDHVMISPKLTMPGKGGGHKGKGKGKKK